MKRLFVMVLMIFILLSGCGADNEKIPVVKETAEVVTSVPILMYHYVRDVDKVRDPLGWNLSVDPEIFEKQLEWLRDNGYFGVHLGDLIDGSVEPKSVVLTFDDGLEDFYTTAVPLLEEYGFTASNAVVTGMIGDHEHMDAKQIREIVDRGFEILSHSVSHRNMASLGASDLEAELKESRDFLESAFGVEVRGFVYPSGKYSDFAVEQLRNLGYKIAVTTEYGEADLGGEMLLLPRIRVDNRDEFERFVEKMEEIR